MNDWREFEIGGNAMSVALVLIAAIFIATIIGIVTHEYTVRCQSAFEHGYEQGSIVGYGGSFWIKAKEKNTPILEATHK